jgi:acyl-ACP thioesterase
VIEFVPFADRGRSFTSSRLVRLSDADSRGVLRPDGLARYLQDVATDDWASTGIEADDTWVVRRTAVRVIDGGRWPTLGERVTLTTWCGGFGAAWAERRTDLMLDSELMVQAVGLWVPVDPSGRPRRLRPSFFDVYGDATGGRRVPGRVPTPPVALGATRREWPVRRADIDVVGHVNNAALWTALSEVTGTDLVWASVTHHGAVEADDEVTLASDDGHFWLVVDDDVRVSGDFGAR